MSCIQVEIFNDIEEGVGMSHHEKGREQERLVHQDRKP